METGPQLKVSSDRLVKLGIQPATPGFQGKRLIHYTTVAPTGLRLCNLIRFTQQDFGYENVVGFSQTKVM